MNIRLFNRLLIVKPLRLPKVIIAKIPKYRVYGITNRTEDNKHILFLDYDNVENSLVYNDIQMLQDEYRLGTCIIRLSSRRYVKSNKVQVGSYHVIFFSKLPFGTMLKILNATHCDANFKKASFQQRTKVLRLSQKGDKTRPSFYNVITARTNLICSKAHIELFEKIDGISIIKYFKALDNSKEVELINYLTA